MTRPLTLSLLCLALTAVAQPLPPDVATPNRKTVEMQNSGRKARVTSARAERDAQLDREAKQAEEQKRIAAEREELRKAEDHRRFAEASRRAEVERPKRIQEQRRYWMASPKERGGMKPMPPLSANDPPHVRARKQNAH